MTPAREASLEWVRRVLAAELATNIHEVLAEDDHRPFALLSIAEEHDVPVELLIQWIQTSNIGKHWSVGEWRRWCGKYVATLAELERRQFPEERLVRACPRGCPGLAQREGQQWVCSKCGATEDVD